ncbi:MAG: chromate transporter [Kiritimatiellia bacterium]|jgi:chromate transporter
MQSKYLSLMQLFIKLGLTAFGGPAAHIAIMEQEMVTRRKWMQTDEFMDLLAITNMIPGPNSTEMTMHIGMHRAGWRGMIIAGISFILPASLITGTLAWLYKQYGHMPQAVPFLDGIKPAVIAIIAVVLYKFGKKTIRKPMQIGIALFVLVLAWLRVNDALNMVLAGMLGIACSKRPTGKLSLFIPWPLLLATVNPTVGGTTFSLLKLGLIFLKTGSLLFGSGYVLFAFLEPDLVHQTGWMTGQELLDAIAIGQFTPGPVLSAATFIGYQIGDWPGAIVATVCIFLPSFIIVAVVNPFIPRMRKSKSMAAFLEGAKTGSVALIAVVLIRMGLEVLTGWGAIAIAVVGLACLIWKPAINSFWLILGGGALGYVLM